MTGAFTHPAWLLALLVPVLASAEPPSVKLGLSVLISTAPAVVFLP